MKERTIDILTAVFLIAFSLVMRSQLEGIPREGVLFPLCVLYLIMASSVLLALRAIMAGKGEMSFFGDIPPQRWCLVTAVFIAQVLGAPESTVSVRLKRAREQLKKRLEDWYEDD